MRSKVAFPSGQSVKRSCLTDPTRAIETIEMSGPTLISNWHSTKVLLHYRRTTCAKGHEGQRMKRDRTLPSTELLTLARLSPSGWPFHIGTQLVEIHAPSGSLITRLTFNAAGLNGSRSTPVSYLETWLEQFMVTSESPASL